MKASFHGFTGSKGDFYYPRGSGGVLTLFKEIKVSVLSLDLAKLQVHIGLSLLSHTQKLLCVMLTKFCSWSVPTPTGWWGQTSQLLLNYFSQSIFTKKGT